MRYWVMAAALTLGMAFPVLAQDDNRGTEGGKAEKKTDEAKDAKPEAATGIQFLTNLDEAKKQAAESKRGLFIVFSTSWCGPCKMLQQKVWSDSAFAETLAKTSVAVKLDGDTEVQAKKDFEIRAYPTILLAQADGKVLARQVGAGGMMTANAWEIWISEALGSGSKLDDLVKAAEEAPQDLAKVKAVADTLYELGRKDEAVKWYDKAEKLVDEQSLQIKLRKVEVLLGKMKDDPTIHEVMDEILPRMMAKKDERVIDISLSFANLIARLGEKKDPARARKMMQDLQAAFTDSDRMIEFRCRAGMFAHQAGDNETALTEMKQIAQDFKDSDNETIKIWVDRCHRFIKTLEGGGKYR